jgi:tetratricopeptide (TPR) repeat protein
VILSSPDEHYDFFLSRRGSVAAIAREVTDVLTEKGYKLLVQDYDIPLGASFVEEMHEAIINSRDLIILFTEDYLRSPYTRKEFTSFETERVKNAEERHIIVLRCEDVPLRGLLADNVYQTLVGIENPEERKRRIIAAAERQSQAAPPPPRPFIGVPPRIASFTGRAEELDRLDAILMQDKPAAVTQASVGRAAVQGMGGVGKTSLAVEYAHRLRGLYAGVCWCPAETRTGVLSALAGLAEPLRLQTADKANVEKAATAVLNRLAEQRATWLLVYDSVASPDDIADLLPSSGARVLITSRFSDWTPLADEVALDVLPPKEAAAFLQSRTGGSDPAGANVLAEALGHLPLALDHAAAYCKRTQMRFTEYADKASSLIDATPRGAAYPRSIAATFNLAIDAVMTQCQPTETLMAYFAWCAPERIPMTLIEGAIEPEAQRLQAIAALAEMSLLKHDPFDDGTAAVAVHRLVQAVARARSETNHSAQSAIRRLIARLVEIYPAEGDSYPQLWPVCAQLTPHLLALREACHFNVLTAPGSANLLDRAGSYLSGRGAYSQAVPLARDALEIREVLLGPEHTATATSLSNLAILLRRQGELTSARPLFERALVIRENVLGREHPVTAGSLNDLAVLLKDQGDLAGARQLHECALAIREKVLGPEHPDTANSLNDFAVLLQNQGDVAGARQLYERAIAIAENMVGRAQHRDVGLDNLAAGLGNLARLLHDQGELTSARPLFERALVIRETVLGPEHPDTAISLNNLAVLLQDQGHLAGARPLHERARAIHEKTLGPEHPLTANDMSNLARLLRDSGDANEAEPLFCEAIAISEKAFGRHHPQTQRYATQYARLLLETGRTAEGLTMAQSALATHEAASTNYRWTKDSARVTADALDALGHAEDAKALRERYGISRTEDPKDT